MLLKNTNVFVTYCQVYFISSLLLRCTILYDVMDGAINHFYWRAEQPCNMLALKGKGILRGRSPPHRVPFHVSLGFSNSSFQLTLISCRSWKMGGLMGKRIVSRPQDRTVLIFWPNFDLKSPLCFVGYNPIWIAVICMLNWTFSTFSWMVLKLGGQQRCGEAVCSLPGSQSRWYHPVQSQAPVKSAVQQSTETNLMKDKKVPIFRKEKADLIL